MSQARPLPPALALGALALVWALGWLVFRSGWIGGADPDGLRELTRGEAFLAELQNRPTDGCVALPHQDPDTVFVGSSHAYAALDPLELSRGLDGRVGVCALPAWNADFLPPFLDYMDAHGIEPDRIVWVVDPAAWLRLRLHDTRLDAAEAVFRGEADADAHARWSGWETGEGALDVHLARERKLRDGLGGIAPADLAAAQDRHRERLIRLSTSAREGSRPLPRLDRTLARICGRLQRSGTELVAVVSPLPRMVERDEAGDAAQRAAEAEAHLPCEARVIASPLADWGLDERHFLNRANAADYDYAIWSEPDRLDTWLETATDREVYGLYDDNHLNPVGAAIFSRELARELEAD